MLLTSKYVIPITSSYIEHGAILVRGDSIVDIGPFGSMREQYPDEEVRDFGQAALMPGFVDLHTHLGYTALRGMFEDLHYADWKREVLRREPFFTPDDWVISSRLGALEAVASGITTVADITSSGAPLVAVREAGLRARVYREVMTTHKEHIDTVMQEGESSIDEWEKSQKDSLVDFGIAPGPIYACHPELFRAIGEYAIKESKPIAMHLAGSQEETDFVRYGSSPFSVHASSLETADFFPPWLPAGTSPVTYVYNWGILDGPNVLAVHCIHADDDDIAILKSRDVAVASCPRIAARLGMGTPRIDKMLEAGLRCGFGTDSPAATDTIDMIDEMRIGMLLQRTIASGLKKQLLTSRKALRMATIDAARALKMEDVIGSLEPGKRADIIAVDLHNSHQNPTSNPESAVIYTANQDNVMMTMVNGRILYDNFVHVYGPNRDTVVTDAIALRRRIRDEVSNAKLHDKLVAEANEDRQDRYNR